MRMDVYQIADKLGAEFGVPAAHVAAVIEVESGGIYSPAQIRFEGHYFDERLGPADRERARKAGLASPKVGGVKNPRSQEARYRLLDRACAINRVAALESTSWGVGQVMGAHWKALGFASVNALQLEAISGLEGQARLMMRYYAKDEKTCRSVAMVVALELAARPELVSDAGRVRISCTPSRPGGSA